MRARSTRALPARVRVGPARDRLRSQARGPSAGGWSVQGPSRPPRGGRLRPSSSRPPCAHSRTPARRRGRSGPDPRGTRRSAPACGRHRRPPAAWSEAGSSPRAPAAPSSARHGRRTHPDGVFHVVTRYVRSGLITSRGRMVDAERREPEEARLAVEQAAEHAGSIEARHAQPIDRSVRCDQSARVAVREEAIVRDRRERRPRNGAVWAPIGALLSGAHDGTHGSCQPPWSATSASAASGPHDPGL